MDTIIDQSGGSAVKAVTTDRRRVIFASTLGTIFEWYDFYLYGSLAAVLGQNFFASVSPISAYIFGLLTFSIGFIVRPFGALVFGRLGDAVGRNYTFLATILIMGLATFAVGILPTYASIGILAPIILISLRMLQGLAVGGEYGGAAVYIAEHAASGRRGAATSWLQTAFIFGLVMSLSIILGTQAFMSSDDFKSWGWRIPFLFSLPLLGISVWVRLKLHESPVFSEMKASKKLSSSPIKEAFLQKENFKRILIVMFGLVAGQGILAASGPIYSVLYLINTLKVDPVTANTLSIAGLLIGVPFYVFFGHLSDRIGRKPLFLAAFALGCVSIFPAYKGFTHFANPVLERAHIESPVVVTSDPDSCAIQFNPLGSAKFTTSCDVAKAALVKRGIPYSNENSGNGYPASVRIGGLSIPVPSAEGTDAKTQIEVFQKKLDETLSSSGYPAKADPAQIDHFMVVALIVYLQFLSAMAFGPLAATLVEIFPARVRYTSMSVPYHIGNGWFGGLLPAIIVAVQASTGSIYSGLWYPTVVVGAAFVICLFLVPETRDRDIAS